MKKNVLFMIHCEQNTGYAIEKLEGIFNAAALKAGFLESQIHWSFSKVHEPSQQIYELDFHNGSVAKQLAELLAVTKFDAILAFDLPFPCSIVSVAKQFKVGRVISYWGASMSDINKWPLLGLKKLEYLIKQRRSADLYLFESKAMQRTATHGRGLPIGKTHVIPLGVDLCQYFPEEKKVYTHLQLKIPQGRKVIFYSGHMEARKGVGTIIKAALKLAQDGRIAELHFVLCGNKNNEEDVYLANLRGSDAAEHVTFAGYRNDIPELMRSSHIGVIASVGWDSFTRSSIEMLASGLPLVASNLGGLAETTVHEETGYLFTPGDYVELADRIHDLVNDPIKYRHFSENARARAVSLFDESDQVGRISQTLKDNQYA